MKDKIAKWYKMGLWDEDKVMAAVAKGVITVEEAKERLKKEK